MIKKLLLALLFFTTLLNATEPTEESVAKLYIATFDRAPDANGLSYWVKDSSGLSLEQIAKSFFDQTETQEKYPPGFSNADFINAVYDNLFDHAPDSGGFNYWLDALEKGTISRDLFILTVMNGAQGTDAAILNNKTTVGLAFACNGRNDAAQAHDILGSVTADQQSVTDTLAIYSLGPCPIIPPVSSSALKKTGQTTSYTPYDDGHYQTGVDHSYTRDAAKEIVTDNVTGLMWQDGANVSTFTANWQGAIDYCTASELGGYTDWRLPTIEELKGIVDYGRVSPAIAPEFINTSSSLYWSSTTFAGLVGNVWGVGFYDGNGDWNPKDSNCGGSAVRCVR